MNLSNGARIVSGYVLWLPESRLVQSPTDILLLGDAPLLRDPPRPDLDLRALAALDAAGVRGRVARPSEKTRRSTYLIDKSGERRALQKAKKARRLGKLRRVQEPPVP